MKNKFPLSRFLKTLIVIFINISIISCDNNNKLTTQEKKYLKQNPRLKVAVFPYYAPYQFINEQGEIDGIFIDFLKLIEQKNNIKFEKVYYKNWEDVLKDTKNNKIDLILEIQETKSRSEYLNFFDPIFESQLVIAQNKAASKIINLESFGKKKLVLPNKYSIVETLKLKYPKMNISTELNDAACLKKVNNGEYDAFVGPKAVVNYFIKKERLTNIYISNTINEKYSPSFAINKKDTLLTSIFSKNLNRISTEEKQKIINNWLYKLVEPYYETSKFRVIVASSILGLLFIISMLSLFLKSEVKKRTLELKIAKEKVEDAYQFKTNLVQNISHEIRTPMNGIIGFTTLLKNTNLNDFDKEKYLDIIANSTKELEISINNILDISQLETKQIQLFEDSVNLEHLFNDLKLQFLPAATKKNIKLELNNNSEIGNLNIKTDRQKLYKIISYIVDNAIKFTNVGIVNIDFAIHKNQLKIIIRDTGVGIDENEKDFVFNSFSQSEKTITRNYGGLGLGLYFAEKYALLLKGTISFESKKSEGSQFVITFNNIKTVQKIKEIKISKIKSKNEDQRFNILIVEDANLNFMLLKHLLATNPNFNFNIKRAENGKEAINLAETNNFDLIFMDIKMPIIDGYEATRTIKNINSNVIIIAHTAFSRDEDIKKAYDSGCNDLISKPIENTKLNEILERYLEF